MIRLRPFLIGLAGLALALYASRALVPAALATGTANTLPAPALQGQEETWLTELLDEVQDRIEARLQDWLDELQRRAAAWVREQVDRLLQRFKTWVRREVDQVLERFEDWVHEQLDELLDETSEGSDRDQT